MPFLDIPNTEDIEKNVILEVVKPELDPLVLKYLIIYLYGYLQIGKVASNQLTF